MVFDAPRTRFVLDAATLALPLLHPDADSAVMFERSCREMLAEIERHESLANELRHLLLSSPGKLPDAAGAAAKMRLGERTLRRRLADEGTTFQAILDEVRCHIATDYLATTHLSTQEIAELLGFSEATNFRRAFMRWTQRSPTSYRKPNFRKPSYRKPSFRKQGDAMIHAFDGNPRSQRPLRELATAARACDGSGPRCIYTAIVERRWRGTDHL